MGSIDIDQCAIESPSGLRGRETERNQSEKSADRATNKSRPSRCDCDETRMEENRNETIKCKNRRKILEILSQSISRLMNLKSRPIALFAFSLECRRLALRWEQCMPQPLIALLIAVIARFVSHFSSGRLARTRPHSVGIFSGFFPLYFYALISNSISIRRPRLGR